MTYYPSPKPGKEYKYSLGKSRGYSIRNAQEAFRINVQEFMEIYLDLEKQKGYVSLNDGIVEYRKRHPEKSHWYCCQLADIVKIILANNKKVQALVEDHLEYRRVALELALEEMHEKGDISKLMYVLSETEKSIGARQLSSMAINILNDNSQVTTNNQLTVKTGRYRIKDVLDKLPNKEARERFMYLVDEMVRRKPELAQDVEAVDLRKIERQDNVRLSS